MTSFSRYFGLEIHQSPGNAVDYFITLYIQPNITFLVFNIKEYNNILAIYESSIHLIQSNSLE